MRAALSAVKLVDQIRVQNTLGECVLWNELTGEIWWMDIEEKRLYSSAFTSKEVKTYPLPERLGAFGFIQGRESLICGFESGFAIYSPKTGDVNWLSKTRKDDKNIRLNDGRIDPFGRFWVGEMSENFPKEPVPDTHLFCLERGGKLSVQEQGQQIANSLAWSHNGRHMYFADSPKHEIYMYDRDETTGYYINKRIFARTIKGTHPDGSCVDAEGFLWNAQWGAGQVVRYSPSGEIDVVLDVPSLQPTCVTFGGPRLDHLIITSAKLGNKAGLKSDNGDVFIYETPYKGREENRFLL